jgi:predicted RNA binding protein YcfA (HicA-like mRNA interferase family)
MEKLLERMRRNPHGWHIEDLQAMAEHFGLAWRHQGTSHVTFRHPDGAKLTIPARRPIKPIYIRQFLAMLEQIGEKP